MQNECLDIAQKARNASLALRTLPAKLRNDVLSCVAGLLKEREADILSVNARDVENAKATGLKESYIDRLTLTPARIAEMAKGLEEIAAFTDPLGKILEKRTLKNGIDISRVSVPLGSIFFIYESRPNVTIDGAALCFKAGNSVILRGGKESVLSGKLLSNIFCEALKKFGINENAVQYVDNPDRELLADLLKQNKYIDLVIPRGGEGLIRAVTEQSTIPVIKHFNGICHVYVDKSADIAKAKDILLNAKTQRPSVCNAAETLLLDEALLSGKEYISIAECLTEKGVELYGDSETKSHLPTVRDFEPDYKSGYATEYLDLKISVKFVKGVAGACEHIEIFGSHHTDAVIAEDNEVLEYFAANVDSSSVMLNASTRFADGGQYGLGAEVGISTDKLHARGPMGVESLCTYKWILKGSGQVRK